MEVDPLVKRGSDYEHERLLKYARALGVSEDPITLSIWRPVVERLIRVADGEIVETLSEHATAHNVHLEGTRREILRLEESARRAVQDHQCPYFTDAPDRPSVGAPR